MTNALNLTAPVDTLAMEFTREFDAPVEALFRAHADPDLVKRANDRLAALKEEEEALRRNTPCVQAVWSPVRTRISLPS